MMYKKLIQRTLTKCPHILSFDCLGLSLLLFAFTKHICLSRALTVDSLASKIKSLHGFKGRVSIVYIFCNFQNGSCTKQFFRVRKSQFCSSRFELTVTINA